MSVFDNNIDPYHAQNKFKLRLCNCFLYKQLNDGTFCCNSFTESLYGYMKVTKNYLEKLENAI